MAALTTVIGLYVDRDIFSVKNAISNRGSANWGWVTFEGLDGTQEHEYWLVVTSGACFSIMLPGGTLNTTALPVLEMTYAGGDSNLAGLVTWHPFNCIEVYCLLTNRCWANDAQSGATLVGRGVTNRHVPSTVSPAPTEAWWWYGVNDAALISGGAETLTQWSNGIYDGTTGSILGALASDLPSCKGIIAGLPEIVGGVPEGTFYTDLNGASATAVSSAANPNLIYMPTTTLGSLDCVNDSSLITDGQHYSRIGHRHQGYAMRDFMHPLSAATSYIAFGREAHPKNFPVQSMAWTGVPVPITLHSPNGNATGTTVTLHTTGSGTFSASTWALSGTVPSSLLTYTPSFADANTTVTISFTNNNGLTNPSPVSFDVVATGVVIDDQDAGASFTGGWTAYPNPPGYKGLFHYAGAGSGSEVCTVLFSAASGTALTPGDYDLYWSWSPDTSRGSNVPFFLYDSDGTTLLSSVGATADQTVTPSADLIVGGLPLKHFGRFTITGTSATFKINNNCNNSYATIDTVALVNATPHAAPFKPEHIVGLRIFEADRMPLDDGYITSRTWDFGSNGFSAGGATLYKA
jgi:hypothetical protein